MAETMPLEMRALALEKPWSPVSAAYSWKNVAMPKEVDSSAAAGEPAWYKAAATWGGKLKSASWGDVPLFFFPDSAANNVEVKPKPAANEVEGKTKAAAVTFFIEPAARVEGKAASAGFIEPDKAASAGSIKPAVKVEAKATSASFIEPASSLEGKPELAARVKGKTKRASRKPEPPEPKVVSVKIEKLSEDDIQYFLKNPMRRPKPLPASYFERFPKQPESLTAAFAVINKLVDEREYIAKQYYDKGYAIVRVEYLDNGLRRFSLPNEAAA